MSKTLEKSNMNYNKNKAQTMLKNHNAETICINMNEEYNTE